jgi:hypothetical protein
MAINELLINNVPFTTLAAPRSAGDPLTVADGSRFGSPTPSTPIRVSLFRGTSPLCILRVTGRSGNVLTVSGPLEGTTDVAGGIVGDKVAHLLTAGHLLDIALTPGPQGAQGYQGAASTVPGPQGAQGGQGAASTVTGPQGSQGAASTVAGPQGAQGGQGPQGSQGAASTVAGPQGPQGYQGAAGSGGVNSVAGRTGNVTLSTDDIGSGTFATGRLGSGFADSGKYLRGDSTWQSISAGDISSGVISTSRLGSGFTDATKWLRGDGTWQLIAASDISSGVISTARLGSGFADATKYLRGDGTWQAITVKRVVALTDGATITSNADTTDIGTVTLGGNRTISNPSGSPVHGQQIQYHLRQDATGGRTVTWSSAFRFGTDITLPTLTTTGSKTDYIGFMYNSADSKWDCVAYSRGY